MFHRNTELVNGTASYSILLVTIRAYDIFLNGCANGSSMQKIVSSLFKRML